MKKTYIVALFAALLTVQAYAQVESETLSSEVDQQIDQLSGSAQTQVSQPQQSQSVVTQTVVVPQQQQIQKQPMTVIEASPLADSRADSIRKGRQEEEMRTESKIVEKLEQSRMEDEKRRAQVLFGDKFDALQNGSQQTQPVVAPQVVVPAQQVAPSSQVQAQPIIIEQNDSLSKDDVREEIRAALEDQETEVVAPVQQKYFSGTAGIAQYPESSTIVGNYSLGAAFGTRYDLFLVEGSFLFSNFSVAGIENGSYYNGIGYIPVQRQINDFFNMNQYQGMIAAKYQLLDGFVRPYLGGQVAYSYRTYESNYNYYTTNGYIAKGDSVVTSHAFDLGTDVGVDLEFNERVSLGANFKYMFNVAARINGDTAGGGNSVEKQQYFITGLTARVNF